MGNAQKRQLNEVAVRANESEARLFVTGFTQASSQGPKQAKAASTARAKAVANYLSNKGVRVWIRYWGAGAVAGGNKANRVEIRSSTEAIPRVLVG